MRIGVDARVLTQPELRGIANYILELLHVWPYRQDEFVLFFEDGDIDTHRMSPCKITKVKVPEHRGTRFKVWHWYSMPQKLRTVPLDLLWCPANIPIPFRGCKQIVTIHDTLLQEPFLKHSVLDGFFYRKVVPYWISTYTDTVITVSSFSKKRINEVLGGSLTKTEVVYNGFPSVATPYRTKEDALAFLFKEGVVSKPYIYALGASSHWKNTNLLLHAFALVVKRRPDLYLIVSGIQSMVLPTFYNLLEKLGITSNVKLFDFIDSGLRNILYQGAEMFVYPSLFEGFGFPPLEAMALGCPVIASKGASIPEIAGEGAYLIDCTSDENIADAILELDCNGELKKTLIRSGSKNIARFSWKECAEAHRNIFLRNY